MTKNLSSPRQTRFLFTLATILFITALCISGQTTSKSYGQPKEPQTSASHSQAFQLVNLVRNDDAYVVSIKNNYDRSINGYTLGIGARGRLTTDLTIGNQAIVPGQVIEERIPVSNIHPAPVEASQPDLTVLAVFFEDGTSDGRPDVISEVKHRRLGTKIQLKRVLALLEKSIKSPGSDKAVVISNLREQITALSETPEADQHPRVKGGLRNAKQDSLVWLDNLERSNGNFESTLVEFKESVKRRIARL